MCVHVLYNPIKISLNLLRFGIGQVYFLKACKSYYYYSTSFLRHPSTPVPIPFQPKSVVCYNSGPDFYLGHDAYYFVLIC